MAAAPARSRLSSNKPSARPTSPATIVNGLRSALGAAPS